MGLYRSTGDIGIDGHNLNSDEAAAREVIAVVGDEGFFDENINLEKLGKYYGQMYVRFDMEKYLGYLERFNLDRKQKYKKLSKVQLAWRIHRMALGGLCQMHAPMETGRLNTRSGGLFFDDMVHGPLWATAMDIDTGRNPAIP